MKTGKHITLGFLCLFLVLGGVFFFSSNSLAVDKAKSYTDAVKFYNSITSDKASKMDYRTSDNCLYIGRRAKKASGASSILTIGFRFKLGDDVTADFRIGSEVTHVATKTKTVNKVTYEYNLHKISLKTLVKGLKERNGDNAKSVLSSSYTLTADSIVIRLEGSKKPEGYTWKDYKYSTANVKTDRKKYFMTSYTEAGIGCSDLTTLKKTIGNYYEIKETIQPTNIIDCTIAPKSGTVKALSGNIYYYKVGSKPTFTCTAKLDGYGYNLDRMSLYLYKVGGSVIGKQSEKEASAATISGDLSLKNSRGSRERNWVKTVGEIDGINKGRSKELVIECDGIAPSAAAVSNSSSKCVVTISDNQSGVASYTIRDGGASGTVIGSGTSNGDAEVTKACTTIPTNNYLTIVTTDRVGNTATRIAKIISDTKKIHYEYADGGWNNPVDIKVTYNNQSIGIKELIVARKAWERSGSTETTTGAAEVKAYLEHSSYEDEIANTDIGVKAGRFIYQTLNSRSYAGSLYGGASFYRFNPTAQLSHPITSSLEPHEGSYRRYLFPITQLSKDDWDQKRAASPTWRSTNLDLTKKATYEASSESNSFKYLKDTLPPIVFWMETKAFELYTGNTAQNGATGSASYAKAIAKESLNTLKDTMCTDSGYTSKTYAQRISDILTQEYGQTFDVADIKCLDGLEMSAMAYARVRYQAALRVIANAGFNKVAGLYDNMIDPTNHAQSWIKTPINLTLEAIDIGNRADVVGGSMTKVPAPALSPNRMLPAIAGYQEIIPPQPNNPANVEYTDCDRDGAYENAVSGSQFVSLTYEANSYNYEDEEIVTTKTTGEVTEKSQEMDETKSKRKALLGDNDLKTYQRYTLEPEEEFEGVVTYTALGVDAAGNEGTSSKKIQWDNKAPTIEVADDSVGIINEWTNATENYKFMVRDAGSGIRTTERIVNGTTIQKVDHANRSSATFSISPTNTTSPFKQGENTITIKVTDAIGNTRTESFIVLYDTKKPTVAITRNPATEKGWNVNQLQCKLEQDTAGIASVLVTKGNTCLFSAGYDDEGLNEAGVTKASNYQAFSIDTEANEEQQFLNGEISYSYNASEKTVLLNYTNPKSSYAGAYKMKVVDNAGNVNEYYLNHAWDQTPPTITSVQTGTTLNTTFSEQNNYGTPSGLKIAKWTAYDKYMNEVGVSNQASYSSGNYLCEANIEDNRDIVTEGQLKQTSLSINLLILIPVKIIDSTIAHNAFFLKKRIALFRNILIRD